MDAGQQAKVRIETADRPKFEWRRSTGQSPNGGGRQVKVRMEAADAVDMYFLYTGFMPCGTDNPGEGIVENVGILAGSAARCFVF